MPWITHMPYILRSGFRELYGTLGNLSQKRLGLKGLNKKDEKGKKDDQPPCHTNQPL
jgi:hypothetical protein